MFDNNDMDGVFHSALAAARRHAGLMIFLAVLLLGVGILFWQVLALGYVVVPGDIPPHFDPVMREAMPALERPQNPLLSDLIYLFHVWHAVSARALQATGDLPLWNPYMLAGQPLVGNAQPAPFYPPNLLLRWLDPAVVASIRSIFNLLVAGLFTYLLGRALHLSKLAATLAAIAFAFSAGMVTGTGYAHVGGLAWLPMTLWAGEKMVASNRNWGWALLMGLGIGLLILSGHPETSFHSVLLAVLYLSARFLQITRTRRQTLRLFGLLATALLLGALLGAVLWLPFVGWWSVSATVSRSTAETTESLIYSSRWVQNLPLLLTPLIPNFFGNPADGTYFWPFDTFMNYLEQSFYFGLVPLALAVGAVFASGRRRNPVIILLAILAFGVLATALRFPGFELINHLPVLNIANNLRIKWYFAFFGAILAGFGLDSFSDYLGAGKPARMGVVLGMALILGLASLAVVAITIGKYVLASAIGTPAEGFVHHLLFTIFSFQQIRTTVSILALVLGVGVLVYGTRIRRPLSVSILPPLLVGLAFAELIVLAYGYNTTLPREQILPPVRLTETLKQDPDAFRIMGLRPALWPNYGAAYGLYHVGGDDIPVHERYARLYEAQGGVGHRQAWSPDWPLVDWMNVKYVISPDPIDLDKLDLVYEDGYYLYRNADVLPRAYMVYDWQVVGSDAQMLAELTSGNFDFGRTVLLEEELPAPQRAAITPPMAESGVGQASVNIVRFLNDSVEIDVDTQSPGILVMSDVLAPGWKASLDGQPAMIYRANYAFRAVFVAAGKHHLTFSYDPLEFRVGAVLSAAGLLILAIGAPVALLGSRKGHAPPGS